MSAPRTDVAYTKMSSNDTTLADRLLTEYRRDYPLVTLDAASFESDLKKLGAKPVYSTTSHDVALQGMKYGFDVFIHTELFNVWQVKESHVRDMMPNSKTNVCSILFCDTYPRMNIVFYLIHPRASDDEIAKHVQPIRGIYRLDHNST